MEELRLLSSSQLKVQQNELSIVCEAHGLEKFNNVKNSKAMRPMKKTNVLVSLHRLQCPLKLFSIAEIVPIVTESIQKQYVIFIYVWPCCNDILYTFPNDWLASKLPIKTLFMERLLSRCPIKNDVTPSTWRPVRVNKPVMVAPH